MTPTPGISPAPPDWTDTTVTLLSALLDSADVTTIGVSHWWDRATSALTTAAAGGSDAAHAVEIACRKLQIETLSAPSARTVVQLVPLIDQGFEDWAATVAREAVYLVALTRVTRDEARKAKK